MEENKKKQLLRIGAALAAVIALLAGWYVTLRKGIYVGDKFFYKTNGSRYAHNGSNYIERGLDNSFEIVSDTGRKTVSVNADENSLTFAFSDGTSLTGTWDGTNLTDSEGLPIGWDEIHISAGAESVEASNTAYCEALCRIYYGEEETRSAWYIQAVGIVIYILGIVTVLRPDRAHFFLSGWRYHNPELSEAGRLLEQASGIVIAVLGVGMMSGVWLMVVG